MNIIKSCMWLAASLAMASGCASQLDDQEGDENIAAVLEEVRLAAQKNEPPKLDEAQLDAFFAGLRKRSQARGLHASGITQFTDHDRDEIPRPGNNPCKVCSLVVQSGAYLFAAIELVASDYFTVRPPFEVMLDPTSLGPDVSGIDNWLPNSDDTTNKQVVYLGSVGNGMPDEAYARFQLNMTPQAQTSSNHAGGIPYIASSPMIPMDVTTFHHHL